MRILASLFLSCTFLTIAASATEVIKVRAAGVANAAAMTPGAIADTRILQEFHRRNPNIQIVPSEGLRIEGVGSEITPLMMIAGGISPDVIYVNFRKIDSYVRQGFLYPLDEFIAQEEKTNPDWLKSRILPQVMPVVQRPGHDNVDHFYAMPTGYAFMGIFFNRPLFLEAGLPMRAPKDWNEMIEFAKKINALHPKNRGLVLSEGQMASWNLMNFIWSLGADVVEEVGKNNWRATFNSKEAADAYEFYYRMVVGERVFTRANLSQVRASGDLRRIGMQFSYIGDQTTLDPSIWGYGAVPVGPTGIRAAEVNARMLGIFSGVKDPKVREAAWKYISFLGSDEADKIRTEVFVEMGLASQMNPISLRKHGYDSLLALTDPGLEEAMNLAMSTAKPEPYGRNCNLIYIETTYPLDQILLSSVIADAYQRGDDKAMRAEIQRILDRAVSITNERMLGIVSPETMQFRRIVAWIVVVVMILVFIYVGKVIWATFSSVGKASSKVRGVQKYYAWGLLFIPLLLTVAWNYVPLARGAGMAVLDYQIILKSTFVGIDNFANVLFDGRFWKSMLATLHFSFWMLTAGFALPVILAYLLHLVPREKILFRTIYYLPALFSGAAVFVLWKQFFSGDGMMNTFLNLFGFNFTRPWADDTFMAMLSCVIPAIWAGAGPGCLIYLAALKTIPEEQFEASEIDGAGFWNKTVHIIFPGLKPLLIINFVGAVTAAFQSSQNILIMTGGGPNGTTEVAALRIFYEAFMFLNFGPATAMAWILGAMLIGFTLIQLKRLSQMEFKASGK